MKIILILVALFSIINICLGYSQPVIKNTRAEGCIDGQCGSHCAWDGAKLFPGDNLNQIGKCRLLRCASNFDILITPCPFDMTGQTEYINKDDSKAYPDCCGKKVPRNRN